MSLEAALVVVYAAAVTAIGAVSRGAGREAGEFALSGRRVGAIGTTLSVVATLFTESLFFFAVSLTALYGPLCAVGAVLGPGLALVALSFVVPRIHRLGLARDYACVTEFCRDAWGPVAGHLARWILLLFLGWVIVLQVHLNGKVLRALLGWTETAATVAAVGLVLGYLLLGGYRAVVRTDVFQAVLLGATIVLPFVIRPRPSLGAAIRSVPWSSEATYVVLLSVVMTVIRPELWQRIYSARTAGVAARGLRSAALLNVAIGLCVVYYAVAILRAAPGLEHVAAFAHGYREVLGTGLAAVFPVLLLAAMMSSLDSAVFLVSLDVARSDVFRRLPTVVVARVVLVLVTVAAGAASLMIFDALTFAYKLNGVVAMFALPVFVSSIRPVRPRVVVAALAVGTAVYVGQLASGRLDSHPGEAVFACAAVAVVVLPAAFLRSTRAAGRGSVLPAQSEPGSGSEGGPAGTTGGHGKRTVDVP